ncbi:hypothetical protein C4901_13600 [Acidiferrobacter sp. SPIII_3]|nr:hypothetical protein C4901_13600 [Acidiferrobacter sp. SPIII_3]
MAITRPNQVWCSDTTYIPMARGFCYLVAIMDWATRAVLSWRLATTLEADSCVEALEEAGPPGRCSPGGLPPPWRPTPASRPWRRP